MTAGDTIIANHRQLKALTSVRQGGKIIRSVVFVNSAALACQQCSSQILGNIDNSLDYHMPPTVYQYNHLTSN
jgi:hypothetical protein